MLRDMPLYVFIDSRMSKRLFLFPPLKRLVVYHKVCHFSCLLSALMRIDTEVAVDTFTKNRQRTAQDLGLCEKDKWHSGGRLLYMFCRVRD